MKKFITINGPKSWISERKSLADAVTSAQNICDHSHEIIVREVVDFTDHTREYENQNAKDDLVVFVVNPSDVKGSIMDKSLEFEAVAALSHKTMPVEEFFDNWNNDEEVAFKEISGEFLFLCDKKSKTILAK